MGFAFSSGTGLFTSSSAASLLASVGRHTTPSLGWLPRHLAPRPPATPVACLNATLGCLSATLPGLSLKRSRH
uniref:Uncharacterized protein n=1 Tax=Oryza meridionalis TaxID=40149 RepID=A0A0E0CR47_9ORYZ